ncbi:MAG: hypothetical protein R3F19_23080 [Verrucomicrobiales bacterium]
MKTDYSPVAIAERVNPGKAVMRCRNGNELLSGEYRLCAVCVPKPIEKLGSAA